MRSNESPPELAAALRVTIGRLARSLRRNRSAAVTPSQLSALVTLDRHGPLRLADLAGHEGVRPSTLTRIVQRLEARGLARRRADPADARAALLEPTAAGRRLLGGLRAERSAALAAALAALDASDRGAIAAALPALDRLLEGLREPGAEDRAA
ncbi:MAG TPA: MarR family transcriptional regulator [Solirubrobacteraceae bacterium]|nr:MarR family transcriptional regulator [Solirubrobacteraceae bacterium]